MRHRPTVGRSTRKLHTQGKADGRYMDTLAPAYLALANASIESDFEYAKRNASAPPADTRGPIDLAALALAEAAYRGYVRCAGGAAAARESCAAGQIFNGTSQECVASGLRQAAAAAAAAGPSADCKEFACACDGRRDGLYPNPANASSAVLCSAGVAAPFECPEGAEFGISEDGRDACVPDDEVKRARPTSLRAAPGMEGLVARPGGADPGARPPLPAEP